MDAKVVTADMASRMMVWAAIGRPNQTAWVANEKGSSKNDGLFPSGYRLFTTDPPAAQSTAAAPHTTPAASHHAPAANLWTGWVLPASEADDWFAAGSAAYYHDLQSSNFEDVMEARRAAYRRLRMEEPNARTRHEIELSKGVIFLDSLRQKLGDEKFFKLIKDYFEANTTKRVTAQSFLDLAGVKFEIPAGKDGPIYVAHDLYARISTALIVYGTGPDAGANRYAAEQLQKRMLDSSQMLVPIRKDFEVTNDELRAHDVVFIGRPESNSALASLAPGIGVDYANALFRINGKAHAHGREALLYAAPNPLDRKRMVLVMAGNDALDTVKLASASMPPVQYTIFEDGMEASTGFLPSGR